MEHGTVSKISIPFYRTVILIGEKKSNKEMADEKIPLSNLKHKRVFVHESWLQTNRQRTQREYEVYINPLVKRTNNAYRAKN